MSTRPIYMATATLAYLLMVTGLVRRKNTQVHFKLMSAAIYMDFFLIGLLEIKKNAFHIARSFTLNPLQQLHVGTSTVAAVLYIPILIFGILRLNGNRSQLIRSAHIKIGITAFIFRTLGFILMFSMIGLKN